MVIRMDAELREARNKLHHRELGVEEAMIRSAIRLLILTRYNMSLDEITPPIFSLVLDRLLESSISSSLSTTSEQCCSMRWTLAALPSPYDGFRPSCSLSDHISSL